MVARAPDATVGDDGGVTEVYIDQKVLKDPEQLGRPILVEYNDLASGQRRTMRCAEVRIEGQTYILRNRTRAWIATSDAVDCWLSDE